MTTRRTTATNDKALAAFIAAKSEIDAQLERLKALSDEHFNVWVERRNCIEAILAASNQHHAHARFAQLVGNRGPDAT